MNDSLKAVELFAGIGGFRLACDRLGIETVWANDIDTNAAKVYRQKSHPSNFVEGDIWQFLEEIPPHDLLTAGFPCQPFSSAGKKLGICDPRGTLFEAIVKILKWRQPQYFVLENVKRLLSMQGGSHFAAILDSLSRLGYLVEWRLLNAANFGLPQNRERIVIVGTFNPSRIVSHLANSEDFTGVSIEKSAALTNFSLWNPIESHTRKFKTWGIAQNGKFYDLNLSVFSEVQPLVKLAEILEANPEASFDFTEDTLERLKSSVFVNKLINGVRVLYNQKGGSRMGYTIYGIDGLAPTLTSTTSRHYERYQVGDRYRRLTNIEYARIQGFPDDRCDCLSVYHQYSLYGNAFPPQMAFWVIRKLIREESIDFSETSQQLSFLLLRRYEPFREPIPELSRWN
ncbi:DNA cytosine methyltransferase [Baaleninema sp.]|uniref:DNA cytosine methyltransferase n=1 Tax=Baaleninema sp. TaxID=3101197 RepID=UPI003D04FEE5